MDKCKFLKDGFIILPEFYKITDNVLKSSDVLMTDYKYKIGRRHVSNSISGSPSELKSLFYNRQISYFFNSLSDEEMLCRHFMITNEFKSGIMERNKWLHFDRWRSYKAMVYLTDVGEDDGPFSVVPKTHNKGAELRRAFRHMVYEKRPNRIRLDYPNLYQEPKKLTGLAGTLILFDTDIFHLGGDVKEGHSRTLIRSHWFSSSKWREDS